MQTWKRKKAAPTKTAKPWRAPVLSVFFLLLTLVMAVADFPSFWNKGVTSVSAATGQNISWLKVPDIAFRLGLDLQGGAHLVYEADMSQIPSEERDVALKGVRDVVERRVNAFGVSEPVVQTTITGNIYRIIVELAGIQDITTAINEIGETPILEFKEENTEVDRAATVDEQTILDQKNAEAKSKADEILARAKKGEDFSVLMKELNGQELGAITVGHPAYGVLAQAAANAKVAKGSVLPTVVETSSGWHIVRFLEQVQTKRMELSHILICFEGKTGCQNPVPAIDANTTITNLKKDLTPENFAEVAKQKSTDQGTASSGGYLGWIEPGTTVPVFELAALALPVNGISEAVETEFGFHIIYKKAEEPVTAYRLSDIFVPRVNLNEIARPDESWKNTTLSGKNLKRAGVEFDPNSGAPYVSLRFDDEGGKLFADLTQRNVGKAVAIFLDGQPISVPVVNEAIYGGEAIITGKFTVQEAKLLAQRLNAGALPVPIHLVSQQTVGPILGKISLERSIQAAVFGFMLVCLYMILFYRLPGVMAVCALILYTFLNLVAYKLFGVTMTLSGIAGFVLSLGMAVDANVLIFERLKDELHSGHDLRFATEEGFKRAWSAIRDGNLTTLISAAVLYGFSSSFIKGFALTLTIGVLLSMFTAIVVTRVFMETIQRIPFLRSHIFYGVEKK
ncbi:MAG: hypothetical protein UU48_C0006G0035 [Candidatus Uhrbacteria bacterium GW2011_GWF2_41_16]|uniref:Protein translocase subunit SecD n=2 Tax=Candidatus Uhriibacteriota TaxID=1752732 RepID=A0A0G0XMH6_9BACT|nr:MAG: hypothetical protein UU35_C0007G0098 [Candidatus Uhrbacteria bacterium GW2011_GWC2_41_11]KKR97995.1 MAG: hypothetical protein UU48_C0006G0035 [Candidatus Uhrbacteria bacterium GW2011_GWF2_41_16]HBO99629.1 protein translocase subunit SecD [Candidatus Uhrbacteria bacterium]